jgi:flavin-dependent dehydrogenase
MNSSTILSQAKTLSQISAHYDCVVVGAGPAGALAAREVARRGKTVLIVDKATFPRYKVCGCCLSASALATLARCGLGSLPDELGATELTRLKVGAGARELQLPLVDGRSVSRNAFDAALVAYAITAGADFLPSTNVSVRTPVSVAAAYDAAGSGRGRSGQMAEEPSHEMRRLHLGVGDEGREITGAVVIVADGLAGTALGEHAKFGVTVRGGSRVGTGAVSAEAQEFYEPATIYMAYSPHGYLGLVRLENGQTDIAAAITTPYLRSCGKASAAAEGILRTTGWPVPTDLHTIEWKGTVPLTRRRNRVAADRIFVIGDAASYVEPFTGEGIAWALQSALEVAPLAVQGATHWNEDLIWRWEHTYRRSIRTKQQPTAMVAELLRHPFMASFASDILNRVPSLAQRVVQSICAPEPRRMKSWLQQ